MGGWGAEPKLTMRGCGVQPGRGGQGAGHPVQESWGGLAAGLCVQGWVVRKAGRVLLTRDQHMQRETWAAVVRLGITGRQEAPLGAQGGRSRKWGGSLWRCQMDVKIQCRTVRCPQSAPNTSSSVVPGQQETEGGLGEEQGHLFAGCRGSCPGQLKASGGVRKSCHGLHTGVSRSFVNKRTRLAVFQVI